MKSKLNTRTATIGLGLALFATSACSSDRAAVVAPARSQLEIPIVDCQTKHGACLGGIQNKSDATSCESDLKQCLTDAAPQLEELVKTLLACEEKARTCLANADPKAAATCNSDFVACVGIDIPKPPAAWDDDAGVPPGAPGAPGHPAPPPGAPQPPQPPAAGGPSAPPPPPAAGAPAPQPPFPVPPGAPGAPGAPGSWPDGGIPPVPGQLPDVPCVQPLLDCLAAGTAPEECANQARECVQKECPEAPDWSGAPQPGPQPPAPNANRGR